MRSMEDAMASPTICQTMVFKPDAGFARPASRVPGRFASDLPKGERFSQSSSEPSRPSIFEGG